MCLHTNLRFSLPRCNKLLREATSYEKWYNEEYEFEIEVTGFYGEITQNIIAEMGKRLGINIPAPMDVRSIKMVRESAQKQ